MVDLGAVGGVVEDDAEHREAQAHQGLQLGEAHQRATVAQAADDQAVGPRHRRPHGGGETAADGLEGLREDHPLLVGDRAVHGQPAHEVAAVAGQQPRSRQQVVEGDHQSPGIDAAIRRSVRVGLVAPAAAGDLGRQLGRAPRLRGAAADEIQESSRGFGGVADHAQCGAVVRADRISFQVHLNHPCGGA